MKTYKVVLAKSGRCGACIRFSPVFEEASKKKVNGYDEVVFESYDLENIQNPSDKNNFESKYPELSSKIEYYPTIFIIIDEDNKIFVTNADATFPDNKESGNEKKKISNAAEKLLINISNAFKSLDSQGKNLFIESNDNKLKGGSKCCAISDTIDYSSYNLNNKSDLEYKSKYLKYKSKYLKLKEKQNI